MKRMLLAFAALLLMPSAAFAADLSFEPVGGGYYIYCNNPEAVTDDILMNGDTPSYIMNNEDLGEGTYYIYISHFNYTGGGALGADAELDVELTPTSDCSYTIENAAFETGRVTSWYEGGSWIKYEDDWGMINCCAKMLGKPVCDIDGGNWYDTHEYSPVTLTGKKGETVWLGDYIDNYDKVHFMCGVHLQAVITVHSGTINMNVCAFKSGDGAVGDRSGFDSNAEFGKYARDRCEKGIADSLPQVTAELEYTIDNDTEDGEYLPVTVYNQYAPDGNTLTEWLTNLNPQDDPWSKTLCAESDMLPLKYRDESKLDYYGDNVPLSERDTLWIFDTAHSDTAAWESSFNVEDASGYSPNFELSTDIVNDGYACNQGNYGVTETYKLTVTNNSDSTRYFNYAPKTASNIIVYTTDKNGDFDAAYTKTLSSESVQTIMSSVELAPHSVTEFSINMILPVNYNGGIRNSFIITYDDNSPKSASELKALSEHTEYPPILGDYLSEYADELPEETLRQFSGNLDSYEIIHSDFGYLVRWCAWDGKYNYYYYGWSYNTAVYSLDEDFNIIGKHLFSSLPIEMSVYNGSCYIRTASHGFFSSSDGTAWTSVYGLESVPFDVGVSDIIGETVNSISGVDEENPSAEAVFSDDEAKTLTDFVLSAPIEKTDSCEPSGILFNGKSISDEYRGSYYKIADEYEDYFDNRISDMFYSSDGLYKSAYGGIYTLSDWAKDDVELAQSYGIVCSYLKNRAYMSDNITRGDFCALAAAMLEKCGISLKSTIGKSPFSDTADDNILAMYSNGIITGYEDNTFRPSSSITRQEAAVMLFRIAERVGISPESVGGASWADADDIASWAAESVNGISAIGIMNGVGDGKFSPLTGYTREQSVITMLRMFNGIIRAEPERLPEIPEDVRQKHYVIYRESYRGNRIELCVYDVSDSSDQGLLFKDGVITIEDESKYTNDQKYYLSCGRWILFEEDYVRVSNTASEIISSDKEIMEPAEGASE